MPFSWNNLDFLCTLTIKLSAFNLSVLCICKFVFPSLCLLFWKTFVIVARALGMFLAHLSTTCSGWANVIDHCLASVRLAVRPSVCLAVRPSVNNYLENLLLWNRPTDFNETSQKWSLGDALSEYFKDMNSMKNSGCHGNQKKKH